MKNLMFSSLIITLSIFLYGCDPCKKNPADCPGGCTSCPEVTSITPSIAYTGETVTIAGKNFGKDATKVTVAFADKNVTANIISQTGDNITVIVPEPSSANEGKEVAVVVKAPAPNGTTILESSINGKFTYKSPTIQSFSPVSGVFGTTVTITGDFGNKILSSVSFNNIPASSFSKINNTTIRATLPKGAGTGKITIQFATGNKIETAQSFEYLLTYTVSTFVSKATLDAFAQSKGTSNLIQDVAFFNEKFYAPNLAGGLFVIEQNGTISDWIGPTNSGGNKRAHESIVKGDDGQLYFAGTGTLDYLTTRGFYVTTDVTGFTIKDIAYVGGKIYATRWGNNGNNTKDMIVFDPNTRAITPFASGASTPKTVVNGILGLYYSDLHAIIKGNPATLYVGNQLTPGALDGVGTAARFNNPASMVMDTKGKIYVADTENHRIRLIDNGKVTTIAGSGIKGILNGIGTAAQFDTPFGITIVNDNTLYTVGNFNDFQIRKITIE